MIAVNRSVVPGLGQILGVGLGLGLALGSGACKGKSSGVQSATQPASPQAQPRAKSGADPEEKIPYDLRRLRPSDQELNPWFKTLVQKAVKEGKRPAVLFSAAWCHACQDVELELGNMHPRKEIGHVRIFELIEEDWEAVTRMDEYNDLRARWHPELGTYPMLFLLDRHGDKVESMQEAKIRLQDEDKPVNFATWFADVGPL